MVSFPEFNMCGISKDNKNLMINPFRPRFVARKSMKNISYNHNNRVLRKCIPRSLKDVSGKLVNLTKLTDCLDREPDL